MDNLVFRNGLLAPAEYWELTAEQKAEICNGCGAKGAKVDFVPDFVLGAEFEEPCHIHDFCYWLGEDKRESDRIFILNLLAMCAVDCEIEAVYALRVEAAIMYFKAVSALGDEAFGSKQ